MNAVLLSFAVLFILSLSRVQLVVAMLAAAVTAGLTAGLSLTDTIDFFTNGITDNAAIALSYALLGAYAAGLSETGLPERFVQIAVRLFGKQQTSQRAHAWSRIGLLLAIAGIASLSQNVIPIHIAFIPVLIPPLLTLFDRLKLDRRAVACALTFGLITPYMLIPVGFGSIFHETIARNVAQNGLDFDASMLPQAMWIPALGMLTGLLTAILFSYRKRRVYREIPASVAAEEIKKSSPRMTWTGLLSIAAMLSVQLSTGSMIYGAAAGLGVLLLGRLMPLQRAEHVFTSGMRQMAYIGFVMMSAAGLAAVLRATDGIESLVQACVGLVGDNRALAAMQARRRRTARSVRPQVLRPTASTTTSGTRACRRSCTTTCPCSSSASSPPWCCKAQRGSPLTPHALLSPPSSINARCPYTAAARWHRAAVQPRHASCRAAQHRRQRRLAPSLVLSPAP